MTEVVGLGEETVKAIETALTKENLTLAPTEVPSSAFTQISIRQALSRGKTGRHIKNHDAWANSAEPPPPG
ncbi:hypothetical protein NicSoilB11_18000 [Arthrobacter sp. NicSoilB11]|nr:hypothetical protein NicSoilB11_18000 [Arthrobacter sp. NicSoilB11]